MGNEKRGAATFGSSPGLCSSTAGSRCGEHMHSTSTPCPRAKGQVMHPIIRHIRIRLGTRRRRWTDVHWSSSGCPLPPLCAGWQPSFSRWRRLRPLQPSACRSQTQRPKGKLRAQGIRAPAPANRLPVRRSIGQGLAPSTAPHRGELCMALRIPKNRNLEHGAENVAASPRKRRGAKLA